jgi:nicotinamide-nucleotide amidase
LREQGGEAAEPIERVFMLGGYPESKAARKFEQAGIPDPADGLEVGYCAAPGRLEIRLLGTPDKAEVMDATCERVREMLGPAIYAEERIPVEEALVRLLGMRAQTVATVEVGSVGILAQKLATTPGGPAGYAGGMVATSNTVLIGELGVSPEMIAAHGSVSEAVALHLASAARVKFRADVGCAVTGLTPEDEGDDLKRPGQVFVAIDHRGEVSSRSYTYAGDRYDVGVWCAQSALNLLWRALR